MEDLIAALSENLSDTDLIKADIKSNIANSIINKRISMHLNQNGLAQKIKKSQATVSKWENGDTNFTIDSLVDIAADLDMEIYIKLRNHIEEKRSSVYSAEYQKGNSKIVAFPLKNNWIKSGFSEDLEEM